MLLQWRTVCTIAGGELSDPTQSSWPAGIRRCSSQPSSAAPQQRQGPLLGLKVLIDASMLAFCRV